MTDEDAAAFMIPAHTAWHAVHRRGKIQSGETVVVLGAAGGLGAAIVQLCVAAGCDVLAVVGGAEKADVSSRASAPRAIDHSTGDVVETIRAATGGHGVDVIVDPVQGEVGARVRDLLVPDGRHVLCGHAGGLIAHDPHFYVRNHTLVGATLGGYPRDEMTRIHAETQREIEALMAAGRYRPLVSRVRRLRRRARRHHRPGRAAHLGPCGRPHLTASGRGRSKTSHEHCHCASRTWRAR